MSDPQAFRVNLICDCQNDVAYGYGRDVETARAEAERQFVKHHGTRTKYTQIVIEQAVEHAGGGSHYEHVSAGIRWQFTDALGSELDAWAVMNGLGPTWAVAMHYDADAPNSRAYVFESMLASDVDDLSRLLDGIAAAPGNSKLRASAAKTRDQIRKLRRAVWG